MDSTDCASHDDRRDSLECTAVAVTDDGASQNRHVTKSPSPRHGRSPMVKKRFDSAGECRCSAIGFRSRSQQPDKKNLYRTYSSFGFKNLNKNRSQSHWSLSESTSKSWPDERSDKKTNCEAKRYELAEYHRCMKLLGVANQSRENLEPSQHRRLVDTKKVKPKIITRLTSCTVSLEDIQDAVLNDFERTHTFDPRNRSFLAQAVYERWYFNKMQERKKQRREAELKNELMRMEFERMRCDQKLKAEKSYQEWMEKKKKNKDPSSKANSADKSKRNSERRFITKNSEKEYVKWKTAKNEEMEKKRHQWKEQKERENDEKQRKKVEAEKAYQAWKNKVSEDLKKKIELQRKREKEKKDEENRNKMEKEKEAVTSFNAWKQNKLQQMKNTRDKQKFESKLKTEARTQRIAERLYEAEQAFYEWLDSVDKRISSAK